VDYWGDFNTIMNTGEKIGGVHPNIRAMNDFSLFQHENNLIDIGFEGPTYTWCNKHPNNLIWERLDRIFVNQAILVEYPNIRILHYPHVFSDHAPLVIYTSTAMSYKSSFKFLSMWLTHEGCEPLVQDVWKTDIQQPPMVKLQTKLKLTKIALKNWNRDTFGNIFQMIREANDRIQQLEDRARNDTSDEIRSLLYMANKNLELALRREELFMREKSRQSWLRDGDRNTEFFHATLKVHQSKQSFQILDDKGSPYVTDDDMVSAAAAYFEKALTAEPCEEDERFFGYISSTVDDRDNKALVEQPSEQEIKNVVMNMNEDASPGPDGFNGLFFKTFWHIVKDDVVEAVKEFFKGGTLPKGYTCSNISLIPKIQNPTQFADLRPISVSNFTYKIIARTMLNRLNKILPKIIAPEQSGFVPNRTIHDNITLAMELTHDINKKTRGGNLIIQVDIEKAYDRVSWSF